MRKLVFHVWGQGFSFELFKSFGVFSTEDAAIARFKEIAESAENHQDCHLFLTAYPLDPDPGDECDFFRIARLSNGKGWIERLDCPFSLSEELSYV